jgi:hypothetical protein
VRRLLHGVQRQRDFFAIFDFDLLPDGLAGGKRRFNQPLAGIDCDAISSSVIIGWNNDIKSRPVNDGPGLIGDPPQRRYSPNLRRQLILQPKVQCRIHCAALKFSDR